jgi:hypothetical protein
VGSYVHGNQRIAVLVCLEGGNAELAKDIAMHIAAINPQVVSKDDMPADMVEKEKDIFRAQALSSGKPPEIVEKMIAGRMPYRPDWARTSAAKSTSFFSIPSPTSKRTKCLTVAPASLDAISN